MSAAILSFHLSPVWIAFHSFAMRLTGRAICGQIVAPHAALEKSLPSTSHLVKQTCSTAGLFCFTVVSMFLVFLVDCIATFYQCLCHVL